MSPQPLGYFLNYAHIAWDPKLLRKSDNWKAERTQYQQALSTKETKVEFNLVTNCQVKSLFEEIIRGFKDLYENEYTEDSQNKLEKKIE